MVFHSTYKLIPFFIEGVFKFWRASLLKKNFNITDKTRILQKILENHDGEVNGNVTEQKA